MSSGREAGELDWEAIGGTWGIATSNLTKWRATDDTFPHEEFPAMLVAISETSPVLARYVQKYFVDMREHIGEIARVVKPGGRIDYIVGNSKFYDVLLPVEQIFASLFKEAGFRSIDVDVIRKRTSKKELFEYVVSGVKPL